MELGLSEFGLLASPEEEAALLELAAEFLEVVAESLEVEAESLELAVLPVPLAPDSFFEAASCSWISLMRRICSASSGVFFFPLALRRPFCFCIFGVMSFS